MTYEGLGEMFESDSADMCAEKISASFDGGPSGVSCMRRPGSEDPHRRERKFSFLLVLVTTAIQNHRRGCRRVSNFCMGP